MAIFKLWSSEWDQKKFVNADSTQGNCYLPLCIWKVI